MTKTTEGATDVIVRDALSRWHKEITAGILERQVLEALQKILKEE